VIAVHADNQRAKDQNGEVVEAAQALLAECRARMPAYMVPHGVEWVQGPLPRNPNGKIDRKLLSTEWVARREAV
jgi:acyl-CoA synthetase (AMP-forming)/AMP-acid ligase II